jgi:hypothetical protein
MKLNIFKTLALGVLTVGFVACEKDYEKSDYDAPIAFTSKLPEVVTGDAEPCGVSAIFTCEMTPMEDATTTNWGILVSKSEVPTLASSKKVEASLDQTSIKVALSNLDDLTTYYYRSFASDGYNVVYGETKSFKTDVAAWHNVPRPVSFLTTADADKYMPYRTLLAATHTGAFGPTTVDCSLVGLPMGAVCATVIDPVALFGTGQATVVTDAVYNLMGFEYDFTGMLFPSVSFDVIMLQLLFNMTDLPGHFEVYVSDEPIVDEATFEKAVKIGSSTDAGKAQELYATNQETSSKEPMKFDIPMEYWGESYVYIVSTADYTGDFSGETSFGIVVFGYGIEVTVPATAE